jgi:hypothetical protein
MRCPPAGCYLCTVSWTLLKGRFCKNNSLERDATYPLNTCTNERQVTPSAFLSALAALSTFAAAMNFGPYYSLSLCWLAGTIPTGFPADYFILGSRP